jgi:hypothetical protein
MKNRFPHSSKILPRLYQGVAPPPGETMALHGVNVIVLCAQEIQPGAQHFPGVRVVLHCPFDDDYDVPLTASELNMVRNTAASVVRALRSGDRVYVSCRAGLNRSGLVVAHAVMYMIDCSGREAKQWVQSRRPRALSNPLFCQILDEIRRPERERLLARA